MIPDGNVVAICDCMEILKEIPDGSIQLICVDPPYNIGAAEWDSISDFPSWSAGWIMECWRILAPSGNLAIFGGSQLCEKKSGDLSDILHFARRETDFQVANKIIWRYTTGSGANRRFSSRHEELLWLVKSNDLHYFNLDAVRIKLSPEILAASLKDPRLNHENTLKGKNPGTVWDFPRLSANSRERTGHPTQKPIALLERIILSLSPPGSRVLDFFAGSGSIAAACLRHGRQFIIADKSESLLEYFRRHIDREGVSTEISKLDVLNGSKPDLDSLESMPNSAQVGQFMARPAA
jgi:DNA modification methylase